MAKQTCYWMTRKHYEESLEFWMRELRFAGTDTRAKQVKGHLREAIAGGRDTGIPEATLKHYMKQARVRA